MRLVSRFASWLTLSLLFALSAAAQSENSAPTFGEIVDVRVINLEVVVTDGKNRVNGLGSEDFRLLVDGEEVPIDYFTEVQGGVAVAAASSETASVPALAPGEAVGTRYLIFIDDSFSIPAQRNRVLRRLSDQLPLLGADDHMAVVAFDGDSIDMLSSWTRSIPELERVFEQAGERRAYGLVNRARRLDATARYLATATDTRFNDLFLADSRFRYPATPRGSYVYSEVSEIVEAATSVMRGFAKPQGRKVMMLLSGGWPAADFAGFSSALEYNSWGTDHRLYGPLVDTANRLGYTLYPVDLKGLENRFGGNAEFASVRNADFAADLAREREWVEEGALIHLAHETGGRALLDGAAFKALERTVEDTRTYYWLGFSPAWQENDERHQVKVEVQGKGLKVRSRKNFSDLSPQTEMTMLVESAQLFDFPMAGEDQELGISFGEPEKGGRRKLVVPMRLEIPLDQLTLLPYDEGYAAQLELRVAATDNRGDRADIPVVPVELSGKTPEKGQMAVYELDLRLRDRPHQLLVSLHEPASGHVFSKRVEFLP